MNDYLPNESLFTVPELAAIFKVSVKTLYGWIDQGKLDAVKIGPRVVRITREAAIKLITEKNA